MNSYDNLREQMWEAICARLSLPAHIYRGRITVHDAIWDDWRSSTVVALCRQVRATKNFTTLPILADALQDAGCIDNDVLTQLREFQSEEKLGVWYVAGLRLVAEVEGGEPKKAVKWIEDYAAGILNDWVVNHDDHDFDYPEDYHRVYTHAAAYTAFMVAAHNHLVHERNFKETGTFYPKGTDVDYIDGVAKWVWLSFDTPEAGYDPELLRQFWENYEAITGDVVRNKTQSFVSCSC